MRVRTNIFLRATIISLATIAVASENGLESMVPRTFTNAEGTTSTIHVNRRLQFTQESEGTRPVRLSKRFAFSSGRDEWCGEQAEDPATDFSTSAPSAADCQALASSLGNENGFWTLQPSDFSSDGWARIVSSGSCSFAARHAGSGSTDSPMRIGTNDIRFYTTRYGVLAKDGKLGLQGTVQCYNAQNMLFVTWGLLHG
ncbi:hypothetical protein ColTof4_11055 [Colletotrichum tofieldiae]|uniref:Ecp2 effector protein-like domain-containing protein n=1 Tax=Colletotrichum tofieldiae TaxID=708197 RepID=A0A161Y731_9PEZI|nr:hypothetical protein CT0861_04461 [Colletotrichum tofieldiae]GKT59836.1 hypothetical protein ColTof3_07175 [Colletotrichum tofieldiae]GKT78632.1 hypothetical protein ColTof4_11055 [Colletotrichum tofieldiae]GKT86014.1 hypothetical protein Ct61P_03864 [Colletotrichum tofieldiae]